ASRATERPDRFMKVCGSSSHTVWPCTLARATRPWNPFSGTSDTFSSRASASTHQKPALCRVASYSGPGLPRPTNSLIMASLRRGAATTRRAEGGGSYSESIRNENGPPRRAVDHQIAHRRAVIWLLLLGFLGRRLGFLGGGLGF